MFNPLARVERSSFTSGRDHARVPTCSQELACPLQHQHPVTAAPSRPLAVEGIHNLRGIGCHVAGRGTRVRAGLLYRSAAIDGATETGHQQLADLGIKTVYDLRTSKERGTRRALAAPVRVVHLPVWAGDGEIGDVLATATPDPDPVSSRPERLLEAYGEEKTAIYTSIVRDHAGTFASLVAGLAQEGSLPAIVHCAAGKDRTGIAVAILLRLVGVPDTCIIADYLASRTFLSRARLEVYRPHLERLAIPEEDFLVPYGAHPPALKAALAEIDTTWGGVEAYLTGPGGLDPALPEKLRSLLLEPDAPHAGGSPNGPASDAWSPLPLTPS